MRNRSSAIAITTKSKNELSNILSNNQILLEKDREEKFTEIYEKKLLEENKITPMINKSSENIINLPTPNFLDFKKEYYTKLNEEKAYIKYF